MRFTNNPKEALPVQTATSRKGASHTPHSPSLISPFSILPLLNENKIQGGFQYSNLVDFHLCYISFVLQRTSLVLVSS